MRIDWWTLGFQTINVLVLIWLLSRLLFKPVAKIMADRQQAAARLLQEASAARDAARQDRDKAARESAAQDAERLDRLSAVASEAERLKATLLADAQAEADMLRKTAEAEAAAMKDDALRANAERAGQFAVDIAARLLATLPSSTLVEGFIAPLADAVRALPAEDRACLGREGETLRLIAPRTLNDDELAHCRSMLATASGHTLCIRTEVDPTLIAGLELVAPHLIVRNSFRHSLESLRSGLISRGDERRA
ncbi:F0F1 ATP synthase subunit B family protein [Burkholderia multivorans]|uniref:F0F1 ATP synthase subunit B family protein n=1 Tax=Burkholderia multivorans TaxID=87883 RepID=UPI00158BC9D8|nr:F0F1 ATP synthase subunit B [Burkholderia multivorans]MDR8881948.1 ATP synthase subunit b, sodium ion specific [Burkholderia multivorans]MDR8886691.1 ATP synthase subunit b, sodium ion specific [Burkholderia multivorans]MDR8894166.1 ATP synthase subunit b, sodium ion specific [Burkholderia multivorans]MDR8900376.1 ATP synthase subunit b, sodium ion specific [Burkholderia multivorans]MDR8906966.1 ATP synthase subunit b, sodium ion specific [Burkholderia multivorans]